MERTPYTSRTSLKSMQKLLAGLCFLLGSLLTPPLLAQPTSAAESIAQAPPSSPALSGLHPRSAETARWFDRAQALMLRAMVEVERAQYADELPTFKSFTYDYFRQIDASAVEAGWVRASYPCLQKLNTLAWLQKSSGVFRSSDEKLHRLRFSNGEKPQLLAELKAYLNDLNIMRPSCIAAAPHYYSDGRADHVLGAFVDIQPSGTQLLVRLRTPLMTDQVLLNHIKISANPNPKIAEAIQKWAHMFCHEKPAMAVMASELRSSASNPAATYQKPMLGNVACGGYQIEPALLAAGFVEIDLAQNIDPATHPTWFAALREARAAKRGIWATDAGL